MRRRTMHHRTARRLLASVAAGAILTGTALGWAAHAHADTIDPHIPNQVAGWCPGGGWGGGYFGGIGYCDGVRYPDGSYWHQFRGAAPFVGPIWTLACVVDDGSPIPPPAPAGGCAGAV